LGEHRGCSAQRPSRERKLEVADVFHRFGDRFRERHGLHPLQRKAMRAIECCRTAALGGHVDLCTACGHERPSYNSCRNRHCPKCQALSQHKWLEARKRRILPTHHFHVVFTLPAQLRALARENPVVVYDLMFRAAADTLLELGWDPERLGGRLGITAVLHTWSRSLAFHPHVHCIVTGGGLSIDGERWVASKVGYLFPVKVLAKLFRGKMLDGLRRLYDNRELRLQGQLGDPACFRALIDEMYRTAWVVYAKPPFGDATKVYAYLGRYTHRVGLSNGRLRSIDDNGVCFATKLGKTTTLDPMEFCRRFLQHVLPHGFQKIRHYGLLSSAHAKTTLEVARRLLGGDQPLEDTDDVSWRARFLALTGLDLRRCPACKLDALVAVPLPIAQLATSPTTSSPYHDSS
jgi:hypothetical protein